MMTITVNMHVAMLMVSLTVPVPSTLVRLHLTLLDLIISVNLELPVHGRTTGESPLKTHCGTGMDVVQATAAVDRLGCCGSVGPYHRK